ncbi:hypothetical protein GCM10011529_28720 [Polymorphobacter glacialis]|uniref:Radical SAM core domain-containing protein n=1 Tax=Sandarakinorhabdus glacialis TaxID=1614636 RepID=A0A916ZZH7_9SPHN|nr:radical SAM protein [Polymorphobacter glacialis]GGE20336.1 hypothetical protein GCM10011529_28720 [Polymorphobacter glacialis]
MISPFVSPGPALDPAKFRDPRRTATGETRAVVAPTGLITLWFNTGTLCNLACRTCYIESSPVNDSLVFLGLEDVRLYLDEIAQGRLPTQQIGFTGGEPFVNRDLPAMLELCLDRGFDVLVLTNAMRPMRRSEAALLAMPRRDRLTFRVSLDHHTAEVHEAERGPRSWIPALDGLQWLSRAGFKIAVAGRSLPGETDAAARAGYAALFKSLGVAIDAADLTELALFPEMDASRDVPEISAACWTILNVTPASIMCASSRMVVKRRGEPAPRVAACTLLPRDPRFDMGATLAEAAVPVALNHPHCARFCVLGGASCAA